MTRPAPRKSSLAGSNPVAPPTQPAAAELQRDERPQAPERRPARAAAATSSASKPKYHKVSFYQDPDDAARMRAAIMHTQAHEGFKGLSQFLQEAAMEKVEQLERKYNSGAPFGAVGAGELPQGRPMGE